MTDLIWHTEKRIVKDLVFYKLNPRFVVEVRSEILKESFNKFNLVEIPVIDTHNTIIAGHQRIKLMLALGRGDEEIDVRVPNRELTEAEFKEYNLRSNISIGEWDMDLLKGYEIDDLLKVGFDDVDLGKFWDNELSVEDDHFNIEKALEEVKENPVAQIGDMFQCGNHRVICGDSTDPTVVKRLVGDSPVQYINSDPPYNIGLDYSKGVGSNSNYGGEEKTQDEYKNFLKLSIENALAVSKPDTHIFYWCDENYVGLLQEIYKELKIENKRLCIWIKNNQNVTSKIAFNKMIECCVYGVRGKPYLNETIRNLNEIQNKEIGSGNRSADDIMDLLNIWLVDRLPASEYQHPTMKSPTLYEKALHRCTKPGDFILDLFGGSGSQLIASEQLKRHPQVKYAYIEKPDRLSRNLKDIVLTYDLVNNYDKTFVFSRDNFVLSKSSNSHAKFQFDIKAILAKNYIDNLSDEVKKGQRGMLEEGKWAGGSSPTGYKKVNKLLVPDEPRASFVTKAFQLYASGKYSLKTLKMTLDAEGFVTQKGKLLTKSNYHMLLHNPIYYGMMIWNGKPYKGIHQPLISEQLFHQTQSMLQRTKDGEIIPTYNVHQFTYRGKLRCKECRCQITGEKRTKTNKGNGKV